MNVGIESKMNLVPTYLKASSPDLLKDAMLENNLILKKEIKYQDIQFVNGSWFAWYYLEIDIVKSIMQKKAK